MANDNEGPGPKKRRKRDEAIAEYKELTRGVQNLASNEDPKKVLELVAKDMKRSKALYPLVSKKLDGTSADARHAKVMNILGKETANHINITQRRVELGKTLQWSKRNIEVETGTSPNRAQFIEWCKESVCMYQAPIFEYFYGTIREQDLEVKEKRSREPREKDTATQATTAKEKNIDIDVEQDQTPKEVEHINRHIRQLATAKKKDKLTFFATLVDPNSFVRTVENIFHSSFLVKEGKIGVKPDSRDKIPVLTVEENQTQEAGDVEAPILHGNQSILSFSVHDFKRWISEYKIKESAFPSREDEDEDQ